MEKIVGIYRITNTITGDFYIGSSKNVKRRWKEHQWQSTWNEHPNSQLYKDMQKYGLDKFVFEILEEVESEQLKETEQKFIELLKPTYNDRKAKGWNVERYKEYQKEYQKTEKFKEYHRQSNKYKEYQKEYQKTEKFKESYRKYKNQLCFYNGETLTLNALALRFRRKGIDHPNIEAKKYLIKD